MFALVALLMLAHGAAANLPDLMFKLTLDVRVPTSFSAHIPLANCNATNFEVSHLPKALAAGTNTYDVAVKGKLKTIGTTTIAVYEYSAVCKYGVGQDLFSMSFNGLCAGDPSSSGSVQCLSVGCGAGGPGFWDGLYWSTTSKKCGGISGVIEIDAN